MYMCIQVPMYGSTLCVQVHVPMPAYECESLKLVSDALIITLCLARHELSMKPELINSATIVG